MIKIFYHLVDFPGWKNIADEQLNRIKDSGLLDVAELHLNLHYNHSSFDQLKTEWPQPNIIWHHSTATTEDREHPTLVLMQQTILNSTEDCHVLYMHLKGVTHIGKDSEYFVRDWRRYMDWFNIVNWRQAVKKLDEGYESVGVNWYPAPLNTKIGTPGKHYSGTGYWTTSKFLKSCEPIMKLPSEVGKHSQLPTSTWQYQYDVEFFIGYNNPNAYCFMVDNTNHYQSPYPETNYINYFKDKE